jgi:ABC-type bacteriocin/lantibiotic exporter with double-glycine peptidase domain
MEINHLYQPDGISCGPTCLKMAADYFKNSEYTISEIAEMCGTDNILGTPPDRMKEGMRELGLRYVEYQHLTEPYDLLRRVIDSNRIPIVRTITKGIPHWIIIQGYDINNPNRFKVYDPWLGVYYYLQDELNSVWAPREYQFFEVYGN